MLIKFKSSWERLIKAEDKYYKIAPPPHHPSQKKTKKTGFLEMVYKKQNLQTKTKLTPESRLLMVPKSYECKMMARLCKLYKLYSKCKVCKFVQ